MIGRGGVKPPGGGGRIIHNTDGLPPDKAAKVLETLARDQDKSIKEISAAGEGWASRITALEALLPIVVRSVTLADGTTTLVTHNLGATPRAVTISPPRNSNPAAVLGATGRVSLVPSNAATVEYDATKKTALLAAGWGTDVVVDVLVWR